MSSANDDHGLNKKQSRCDDVVLVLCDDDVLTYGTVNLLVQFAYDSIARTDIFENRLPHRHYFSRQETTEL